MHPTSERQRTMRTSGSESLSAAANVFTATDVFPSPNGYSCQNVPNSNATKPDRTANQPLSLTAERIVYVPSSSLP